MGQHPRSVMDVNVTVGPWVMTYGGDQTIRSETVPAGRAWEPMACGLYRDRDGDIWERVPSGWLLRLQGGVAVDPETVWGWFDGHVCDYAPFTTWH